MSDNYTSRVQFTALDLSTPLYGTRVPRHRSVLSYAPILMQETRSSLSDYPADGLRWNRRSNIESWNRAGHAPSAHVDLTSHRTDKAAAGRRTRRLNNTDPQNAAQVEDISPIAAESFFRTAMASDISTGHPSSHSYIPRELPPNRGIAAQPSTWFPISQGGSFFINGTPVWIPSTVAVGPASCSPFAHRWAPPQTIATFFPGIPAARTPLIPHAKCHYDLSVCPLEWCIANLPSTAKSQTCNLDFRRNLDGWAGEPAYPRANHFVIKYDHNSPNLTRWQIHWGRIEVDRRVHTEITVEDVLQAIHSHFQVPMMTDEYEGLPLLERNMVFSSRFRRTGGTSSSLSPLLRLDILEGLLDFRGLTSMSEDEYGTVVMSLSLGPSAAWMKWPS